jgi:hypothetical protein
LETTLTRVKAREASYADQSRRIQKESEEFKEKSGFYDTIRLCLSVAG